MLIGTFRTMTKKYLILSLFVILIYSAKSQECNYSLFDSDYKGLKIIKTDIFKGEQLYNYIDGGADLFFEYGFNSVTVQDLDINGNPFMAEFFCMGNLENAIGITSIFREHVFDYDSASQVYYSASVEQTQFFLNNYYIRIVNNTDFDGGKRVCMELMSLICKKYAPKKYTFPFKIKIDKDILSMWNIKICYGRLGLQNALSIEPDYYAYLQNMSFYYIAMGDNDDTEIRVYKLTEESQLSDLLEQLQISRDELVFRNFVMTEEDGYFLYKKINSNKTLFIVKSKEDARSKTILDLFE